MTRALSGVTFWRISLFVLIPTCLLINSFAFFIGCDAVGEADGNGFGRFEGWLPLTVGEGAGRGGVRRGTWAFVSLQARRATATTGMKRRKPEVTLI
jgi:hypothetical protein